MKILYIVTRGDLTGGAQIHVRDLAIAVKKAGHSPLVLAGSRGDFTKWLEEAGIPYSIIEDLNRSISPIKDIKAIRALRAAIRSINPDIISTHTAKAGLAGRIAAILEKKPVLFTAHGWQFADGIPKKQAWPVLLAEKLLSGATARIITVSEYDYHLALKKKAVKSNKLCVVHNGLPDLPEHTQASGDSKAGENRKEYGRLIMIARFQQQKDHATLFHALQQLKKKDWQLDLVGDGPDLEKTRALSIRLGLDKQIHFLGQRTDIPDLLKSADIFVLASNWEGFPRSIIEAMRAALPVIASDVGGCAESVCNGITGYLVPIGNVDKMTEALHDLLDNPQKAFMMGQAGRKRYEEFFRFETMLEKTLTIYNEILAE